MDIFKIAVIGICGGITAVILKNWKSEFVLPLSLITGMVIIYFVVRYIYEINASAAEIALNYGIDISYIKIIMKVMCIAYVCQFACDLLKDSGISSVAGKVELAGKLIIFSYALPVVKQLLKLAAGILDMV